MSKSKRIAIAAHFAAAVFVAAVLPAAHADLIVDGSFEGATNNGANSFLYNATSPNWTFAATSGIIVPPSAFGAPTTGFDGSQIAFLQSNTGDSHSGGNLGGISQNVTFPAPGVYQFSTLEAYRTTQTAAQYGVAIGGQTLVKHSAPTNAFTTNTFKFLVTPNLAGSQTFALNSTGPNDSTTFLDKVSITPSTSTFSTRTFSGDADSGISSAKTYTHAVNFNGPNVTINGVTFTGGGVTGTNYALTTTNAGGSSSFTTNTSNVTGSSHDLFPQFFYGGTETLTLTGLTPGTTYTTTLYNSGFGSPGGRWATVSDSLGNSIVFDENNSDAGNGNLLQDTYTADATGTVAFTFLPTSPGDTYHMYAFSNEVAAPEPGSMALLGIAAAGLLRRRRR
jgi:hypothetical protein